MRKGALAVVDLNSYHILRASLTTQNVLWSRASVYVCVFASVHGRTPTLLHGPGCNFGRGKGCP